MSAADWPAQKRSRFACVGRSIIQLSKIRGAAERPIREEPRAPIAVR